jgi:hypothetical protein
VRPWHSAVPSNVLTSDTRPFTLAAWVKPTGVDGGDQTVLALPATGGEPGISLGIKRGGALAGPYTRPLFRYFNPSTFRVLSSVVSAWVLVTKLATKLHKTASG